MFDRQKFKELVLHIASKSQDDPKFGATKLNKILFFSDFLAYAHLGTAITGAEYQRLAKGPAPRAMVPVRNEMLENGDIRIEEREYFGRQQSRVVPLRLPTHSVFTMNEIALVDNIIEQLRHHDAVSISDLSHEASMAWQAAFDGETIPYSTVFVSVRPPTPSDVARGQELAREHGW